MPFSTDYSGAAFRHFSDAEFLENTGRYCSSGYHYGFAAECAFKAALLRAGIMGLGLKRRDPTNPMWTHFGSGIGLGSLRQRVLTLAGGRLAMALVPLFGLAGKANFMNGWDIAMRYAPDAEVTNTDCASWQQDALAAIVDLL